MDVAGGGVGGGGGPTTPHTHTPPPPQLPQACTGCTPPLPRWPLPRGDLLLPRSTAAPLAAAAPPQLPHHSPPSPPPPAALPTPPNYPTTAPFAIALLLHWPTGRCPPCLLLLHWPTTPHTLATALRGHAVLLHPPTPPVTLPHPRHCPTARQTLPTAHCPPPTPICCILLPSRPTGDNAAP